MKKRLVKGLAIALALGILAACSNGKTETASGTSAVPAASGAPASSQPTDAKKPVNLKLSIWGDESRQKLFEELMAKYKETHPNVSVEVILIPFADYQQKLSIMLASKTGPDVAWLAERMVPQLMESNQLMDLSALASDAEYDLKDVYPSTMDIFKKDGKVYGVTTTSGPKVIFYNKKLFQEKGLKTPIELFNEGKWNYDEFIKAAKTLTDPSKGVYGINLFAANGWKNWQDALMDTIWSYGADLLSADGSKFLLNSPEGEKVMQLYYDMLFNDQSHLKPGDQTTFETGKLAMVRHNYSYSATARNIKDFDWDIAPMPKGPKSDAPPAVGVAGFSVLKDSPNKDAALDLLKYVTSKEGMKFLMKTYAPARKSILESDDFLKMFNKPSVEGIKASYVNPLGSGVRVQPSHKNWQQIDVKMQTLFDLFYAKTETPKSILERMDKEVSPLLK